MNRPNHVFVSDSVTRGHPDKLCDQISDGIVDRFLARDAAARVTAECAVASGIVFLAVRSNSEASVDITEAAREVVDSIGYRPTEFDGRECTIMSSVSVAADERLPVDANGLLDDDYANRAVAHEQVTLFGFACGHTAELMPLPVVIAHALARAVDAARIDGSLLWLSADCKTQVAVGFENGTPREVKAVALTITGDATAAPRGAALREAVVETIVEPVLASQPVGLARHAKLLVHPTSRLVPGGPGLHAGLTGRKTAVDSYGEYGRHGGAALSGKDPFRIDRLGAYGARYLAKNVVAAGLASECEVQVSYGIGEAEPLSLYLQTFGTETVPKAALEDAARRFVDLRPAGLLAAFALPGRRGEHLFRPLAVYGHMGRSDLAPPWEDTARAGELAEFARSHS